MEHQSPKAILVVSFGTSYEASRKATIEKIEQDTERDNFMSADEAVAYGLVDQVVTRPTDVTK